MSSNEDQQKFWNTGPGGQSWSGNADDLDTLIGAATTLLFEKIDLKPDLNVLDVGCGAGATTLAVAQSVGPDGQVLGIDFARPLLELANFRLRAEETANARFVEGDGQTYAFPSGTFDLAVSRFGVMFFSDPVAAFANIRSGLRPGGRIAFVAWASASENPWFWLPHEVATARLGPIEPTPPGTPGPTAFADTERVLGILASAGFAECHAETHSVELGHPGGVDALIKLTRVIGPVSSVMRERGGTSEDLEAILANLAGRLADYAGPDGISLPARINLFRARNP